MRVFRTTGLWLVAFALVELTVAAPVPASEFSERLAAWQGVAPPARQVAAAAHQEPVPTEAAAPEAALPAPPAGRAAPHSQWHDMAFAGGYGPGCNTCGPAGCGACGDFGPQGCDMCCGKPLWWARFELLMWWRQGRDLPPLVTSGDASVVDSTEAGILPDASILFGGGRESSQMQAGGRMDLGFWLDPSECLGVGNRFYGLGRDDMRFQTDSFDNPVLAIPFIDVDTEEALLLAYPGLATGSVDVRGSSEVLGNDLYARFLICRDCDSRLDFVTGWSFSRINDDLRIRGNTTVTEVGGNIPIGTETEVFDRFDTRNEFHGVILGLMHEYECRCWSWQTMARMSIGNMNQRVIIDGQTSIGVPGDDPEVTAGGLFTNPDTNIGEFSRNEFTAVTEVGLNLAYHVGPCTKLTVGYSFLYWSDVLRPGDHIDRTIGDDRPAFRFNRGDYWVQGVNLGFVREF